jgi:hypothetical protein
MHQKLQCRTAGFPFCQSLGVYPATSPLSRKDVSTEDLVRAVDRSSDYASRWIGPHVELLRHDRKRVAYYLGDVVSAVPVPLARLSLISHSLVLISHSLVFQFWFPNECSAAVLSHG